MTITTSEKIKNSALQLFAQKGYYGTSLNEIAEMVGIKKPSLYAHFKNKDDLYKTVIIELLGVFTNSVSLSKEEFSKNTTKEQLLLIVKKMVEFWKDEELGLLYKRSMLFPEEQFQNLIKEQFDESETYTTKILEEIFTNGMKTKQINNQPIEPLIDAFYCLVDGLFVQRFFYPLEVYEQKVIHAFEHYWKGIDIGGKR